MARSRSSATRDSPWLYGPGVDLLLGAGFGYLLSVPVLVLVARLLDLPAWPGMLAVLLALVLNTPHYGATLLRVYEQREDRRLYALFAVYATGLLAAAFVAALHWERLGSWLITLYFSWSPWHFAGQNYGLALMFLRRGGVEVSAPAKRALYASFVLSFLLALLAIHEEGSTAIYAPGPAPGAETYALIRLGIPSGVVGLLMPPTALLYLGSLAWAAFLLRGRVRILELAPVVGLVLTQALWFALPALGASTGLFALGGLPFVAVWISAAHSVQYLWITSYYARHADPRARMLPYLGKTLLAGSAIVTLPGLLFAPTLLGTVHWYAGLAVLIFAVVNLHHFVLDGAVWKLRDGRVARVLLRARDPAVAVPAPTIPARSWVRPAIWAAGAASVALSFAHMREHSLGIPGGTDDARRVETAARRLAWMQRPNPAAWGNAGGLYAERGHVDPAIAAYREALALDPSWVYQTNLAWLLATRRASEPEARVEAVALAEQAARAQRNDPEVLDTLAAAYAASGRFEEARRAAAAALELASAAERSQLAAGIERRLELYRMGRPFVGR